MAPIIFTKVQLHLFTQAVFKKCGLNPADSILAADVLLAADLRGIDSHGVARLSGYVRLWESGRINMKAQPKILHQTPSTATLDADEGLGLIIAPGAMELAIEKATQVGTGWVAVQNSSHFGIAAFHAMLALPHDMIGICMTNASPLVAPTYSKERMLGTNPVCIAVPAKNQQPFIIDMATSNAANGKLEISSRLQKPVPDGWVQTTDGRGSTDADELKKGGSLLPLGGHKGYGLGAAVDILSAVLSGANYGPWVPPFVSFLAPLDNLPGKGIGHFIGAMRIDAFRPADNFKKHMDQWILRFKDAQRTDPQQEVLIPGEPEYRMTIEREKNGIPLNENVVKNLQELALKLALTL
ncbi:MAG: Ldh family oxidoreductase [Bacteroidia bacterium]|nr:Ldh family oxidoreductase [Bacteroidia bacterium]